MEVEVRKRLQDFVTNVVVIYEKTLNEYIDRIENNIKKEGKTAKSFMSIIEIGKTSSELFEGGTKVLYTMLCDILLKIVYDLGVQNNRNNVKKILDHLYEFKRDKEGVRKKLVEAAYTIFRSFEWQFAQATSNATWERAMTKLAEDAVGRAFNYFKDNTDVKFSVDSVVRGVIFGKSKSFKSYVCFYFYFHSGRTVQNKQLDNWNTSELFSKVGLTDGLRLCYSKKDETSNTTNFGYRLPLQFEDDDHILDMYDEEQPLQPIHTYVVVHDDIQDKVKDLLDCIDNDDYSLSLKKVEKRIKEVVKKQIEDIKPFLGDLKTFIEKNYDELKEIKESNVEVKKCLTNLQDLIKDVVQLAKENIKLTKEHKALIIEALSELKKINSRFDQVKNDEDKPILWHVEKPNLRLFAGRVDQLKLIATKLEQKIIPVICGLGGVGKTELANQYAYKTYKNTQFPVIYLDASTDKKVQEGFAHVHHSKLKLARVQANSIQEFDELIVQEVFKYLGKNSLFIFDNAENYKAIKKFLKLAEPYGPLRMITSNNILEWRSDILNIETVPLTGFEKADAIKFVKDSLIEIKQGNDDKTIELLVETLHKFPLALSQAVAYINSENIKLKGSDMYKNLTDYVQQYNENPKPFFDHKLNDSEKTMTKTLQITIATIKKDDDYGQQAVDLLNYISYFKPNNIPQNVFLKELAEGDKTKWRNIIHVLKKYDILYDSDGDILNVHGLVQTAIRLELKELEKEYNCLEKLLVILKKKLNNREDVKIYSNHIISIWNYAHIHKNLIDDYILGNKKDAYTTYFHLIAEGGNYVAVKAIVERINTTYPDQLSILITHEDGERGISLHNASISGNVDIVKLLIEHGAKITEKRKHGWTPLHLACKNGHLKVVQFLLDKNASVRIKTGYKWTPLHFAAEGGFIDIVKVLLRNNETEINARNKEGFTPLHLACKHKYLEVVQELLAIESIEINAQSNEGNTPLHEASIVGHVEIIEILIIKNARTDITNEDGKTARDLATDQTILNLFPVP